MQFQNQQPDPNREIHRKIEACMETGNFDAARTLLTEFEAENPEAGRRTRALVARDYGVAL